MAIKDLTIAQLRTIVAIEDNGGVAPAGKALNITQTAVTLRVKEVNSALDIELYTRWGRKNVLTDEGKYVLQVAREIVDLHDHMINSFKTKQGKGE